MGCPARPVHSPFGLQKRDVDLKSSPLTVRRSCDNDNDTTEGAREEAGPIAAAWVPYLEAALEASKGALLFPRTDGEMRTEADKLGKRLRRALSRAGIVEGYLHLCRRCKHNGTPHEEKHPDCERRHCPKCKMLLWAKALPRASSGYMTRGTRPRPCSSRPASTSTRSPESFGTATRRSPSRHTRTSCPATCTRRSIG